MKQLNEYEYDLFLSWTGADRELKNSIADYFHKKYGEEFKIYDSDTYCNGDFRDNYCQALDKSKVYVLILTDNLRSNAAQRLTEVRNELNLALDLEASRDLNIIILCFSPFFRYEKPYHDYNDEVGWFFYTRTRGFSRIDAVYNPEAVPQQKLEELDLHVSSLLKARNEGRPALSQTPRSSLITERVADDEWFFGRESDLKNIDEAFASGAQLVVLSGMGGIGKTKLAEAFARYGDEHNRLKCVQIVHVQDMTEERDGLKLLVSEAMYENSLLMEIAQYSQRDQYNRKLNALRELPEYTLLVLDNFNTVNDKAVADLVSSLKCRMIVTSRGTVDEKFYNGKVKLIKLACLDEPAAFKMFKETSGRDVSEELFRSLYVALGGHTITLCMTAKILREHPDTDFEKLISELDDITAVGEKTEFAHNENNEYDTLLGHLKKLFDVSKLDGECTRILRHMSLLSDGTIPVKDLVRVLGLNNDNSVLYLIRGGWLERVNCDGADGVRLHSILSQLVQSMDKPTEENCAEIINYLCETYDNMRDNILLAKVGFMEDKLYFALYRLALSCGKLNGGLWQRFVDLSHLTSNLDDLKVKTESLEKHLAGSGDKKMVTSYYDMAVIERRPAELDIIEKYVDGLRENAGDYKWVLRALSVTLDCVGLHPDYKNLLRGILKTAVTVAEEKRDDFGVLNLSLYYMLSAPQEAIANLNKYIKLRKREKSYNGTVISLDQLIKGVSLLGGNIENAIEQALGAIDSLADESDDAWNNGIKILFKHPIKTIKIIKFNLDVKRAQENLPSDDPFKFFLETINGASDAVKYNEEINAQELFEMTVRLYEMTYTRGMTLATLRSKIEGIIALIKRFPEHMQGEIRRIAYVCDFDPKTATIGGLARLQIACLINGSYMDKKAVEQSLALLDYARRSNAENNYAVVSELIRHGNTLVSFGMDKDAFEIFYEAYEILKENAPDSEQLYEVCRAMLNLKLVDFSYVDRLREIRDTVINISGYSERSCNAAFIFINNIKTMYENSSKSFETDLYAHYGGNQLRLNEAIKNYIIAYTPYTVSKIILEKYDKSTVNSQINAEEFNGFISKKFNLQTYGFTVTEENLKELDFAGLIWLVGSQVVRAYLEKIDKYAETGVKWDELAVKYFIRTMANDLGNNAAAGTKYADFIDASARKIVAYLWSGHAIDNDGTHRHLTQAEKYTLSNEEARSAIEYIRATVKDLSRQADKMTEALKQGLASFGEIQLAFRNAFDVVLEQADEFEKYPRSAQNLLVQNLSYLHFYIYKLKIAKCNDFGYWQKVLSVMENLKSKVKYKDVKNKLSVCISRAKAFEYSFAKDDKMSAFNSRETVKLGLKYKTDICAHVRYAMKDLIYFSKNCAKNGGFRIFLDLYAGEKGKYRKKCEVKLKAGKSEWEESCGNNLSEYGFLELVSKKASELSSNNYNISTHEFFRIAKKRFSRYGRYAFKVLSNILESM